MAALLQVPGYDDDDPGDHDKSPVPPLTNPPPDHKLLTHLYDTFDELVDDLHEWAAQALFGIRKQRSINKVKDFGYTRVDFCCLRDKIRPSKALTKRQSSTTKTGCEWQASAKALTCNNRRWTLEIREGCSHNHAAAEDRDDIVTFRKFKPEHVAFVGTYVNRPAVTNRQLAEAIRKQFSGISFTRRQLRDLRFRLGKAAADGYTPFQGTMKLLDERGVPYRVLWSAADPNKPEGLVWTSDFCKQQWALNPWVQMYDNTYKTNNKGLAFFQVMSIGSLNKVFSCAFGLINNERQEGFDWLMDQVNVLRQEVGVAPPVVTITDFDAAMRNAVARVYPDAKPQLCIFHVNKNVILHIKGKWDKQAATIVRQAQQPQANPINDLDFDDDNDDRIVEGINRMAAQGEEVGPLPETVEYSRAGIYELWKHMLYASTTNDFNTAWERLQSFFETQPAIIQYLEATYMPVVQEWAACYTGRNLNFGHRTTSPVESANRYLKSFLIRGSSTVKQVVEQSFEMVNAMEEAITEARRHQKNHLRRDFLAQAWLGNTPTTVALQAMNLVTKERRHMMGALPSATDPDRPSLAPCTGRFTTQLGIPCRHELLRRHQAKDLVLRKEDFHPY